MIYTFHRKEGFYPLELNSNEEAKANALRNPGTLKVVNEITKEIIYQEEKVNGKGEKVNSPIFGEIVLADKFNRLLLEDVVTAYPLDVFQILNKDILNPKGFQISIVVLES